MKNKKIYFLSLLVLIIIGIVLALRFSTNEDTWLCKNGIWEKHGNPSAPKPTTGCDNQTNVNQEENLIVKDNDGKVVTDDFEINLPYGWYKLDNPIPGVTLMVVNGSEQPQDTITKKINFHSYFAITYDTTSKTLNDFLPEYENKIKSTIPNAKIENINDVTINGYQAKAFEILTSQQNVNMRVFVAIIKGNNNDIWVFTLNTTEQLWANYQTFIPDILNTFKIKK